MNNTPPPPKQEETQTLKKDISHVVAIVKANLIYILGYVVFFIILVVFIPSSVTNYLDGKRQIMTLRTETEALENSVKNVQGYSTYDLTILLPYLNTLVPGKEDFFSVISAANLLANRHGVLLLSHTSPFKSKDKANAVITMTLQGSPENLLSVLQDYSFSSGRFMTVVKVMYQPQEQKLTIDAQFPIAVSSAKLNTKTIVSSKPLGKPNTKLLDMLFAEAQKANTSLLPTSTDTVFQKNAEPFGSSVVSPTFSLAPTSIASPSATTSPTP